jgi:hypothetical protein
MTSPEALILALHKILSREIVLYGIVSDLALALFL